MSQTLSAATTAFSSGAHGMTEQVARARQRPDVLHAFAKRPGVQLLQALGFLLADRPARLAQKRVDKEPPLMPMRR